jgi:hypothetical protein
VCGSVAGLGVLGFNFNRGLFRQPTPEPSFDSGSSHIGILFLLFSQPGSKSTRAQVILLVDLRSLNTRVEPVSFSEMDLFHLKISIHSRSTHVCVRMCLCDAKIWRNGVAGTQLILSGVVWIQGHPHREPVRISNPFDFKLSFTDGRSPTGLSLNSIPT